MSRMREKRAPLSWGIAAALCCLLLWLPALRVCADDKAVYDNAGLLSAKEVEELEAVCSAFEEETGSHMVLLTEVSGGTVSSQTIADDFYDKKYPNEKDENGICFLIDMGQRQLVISTSGIMRYYMSDQEIDEILDAVKGDASSGSYGQVFSRMAYMTKQCYDRGVSEGDYLIDETGKIIHYRTISTAEMAAAAAGGLLTGALVYVGIAKRYRRRRKSSEKGYARMSEVQLNDERDILIDRHVITRRIPKDPPPGGGGGGHGGGGSSVHTASSGRSHGGGSKGF